MCWAGLCSGIIRRVVRSSMLSNVAELGIRPQNVASIADTSTGELREWREIDQALASRDAASARVTAARSAVETAEQQVEYTLVRAPYAGIVEEGFATEAIGNPAKWYDAEGDPKKLEANVSRMIESCKAFLDLGAVDPKGSTPLVPDAQSLRAGAKQEQIGRASCRERV